MATDDLTARLRKARVWYDGSTQRVPVDVAHEAADRIEELEARLAYAKWAADAVLAPICAVIGRSLYQWRDCPNLIAEAHEYGVVVSAANFANLYEATNWDDVVAVPAATAIASGDYAKGQTDAQQGD